MATISNSHDIVDVGLSVKAMLELDGGVVTEDLRSYFRPNAVKNILSRRKPVPLNVKKCQDYDPTKDTYYSDWWRGEDGMCGINVPDLGSADAWSYNAPRGTEDEPCRLNDFLGYATLEDVEGELFSFSLPNNVDVGSSLEVSLVVNGISEWTLGLADLFDAVCVRMTCEGLSVTKEFSSAAGTHQMTFTSEELSSVGAVDGSTLSVEVFGKKNGVEKSLKYAEDVVTAKNVSVRGALPYYPQIRVTSVKRNPSDPVLVTIQGLTLAIAGRTPEGDTLEGGTLEMSVLGIYLHNGTYQDAMDSNDYYAASFVEIPTLEVASGSIASHRITSLELTDSVVADGKLYAKMSFLWIDVLSGREIALATIDVV